MSAYDFDPKIEGTEALMRWAQAAHESLNGHSASERLYGRELLSRSRQLIDDILSPTVDEMASEAAADRAEARRYG